MKKTKFKQHLNFITYITALFVIIITLIFCFAMISNINQRMSESATSNLLNTTQVIEGNLGNYIEKDFESLNVVGDLYKNGLNQEDEKFAALCKTMGFEWIGIADTTGNGIDSDGTSFYVSEKPWHNQWQPEQSGYSDAYYGNSGRLQTTLWYPIYENDKLVSTVFADVLLNKYYSANIFTFYEGAGRTYLFDSSDGKWILKSLGTDGLSRVHDDIYSLIAKSGNDSKEVQAFRQAIEAGKTGTVEFVFNQEWSYVCFMPLSSSPDWYIATVIARDVLLKESDQVQKMIQLILLFFFCAIFIFAVIFIKWQNRQTKFKEASYREALFANIFSNVDSVFLIYDKQKGKTAFISDNVNRILGLKRHTLKMGAEELFDWCGIEESDPLRIAFFKGELNESATREVCVENKLGLGTRFIRMELIPADMGQEIILLTDITADKDIQNSLMDAMQRAESASRAKDDFLSSMSHDIRTPMNGVIGMTAIAAAHLDDKNRVKDCLNKINEASAHLLNLINEILDVSRIESGKIELSKESFNLGQLIQEVLNMNYTAIKQKDQTINVHIQSLEHEQVVGDLVRMQRLVANLLSNAVKYTPDGGTISITLEEKPPEVKGYGCYELIVQDNGIGMSKEFQKKLFQPFEREEDVRSRRIQGTGLGMSIVKNIVSLMMGSIEVESEKSQGTTFRVKVNLKLDEYEYSPSEKLSELSVLVVNNDHVLCKNITSMLLDIGMFGEWADNCESAVSMILDRHRRGDDYLAVLLDWNIPKMDGLEVARRIRAEVGDAAPVIILTAYDWGEIEVEAREAGVDDFLDKPIYKTKLMLKMMEFVDKSDEIQTLSEEIRNDKIPEGKRVLVAEDNQLNREITAEILKMLNLEIVMAEDGTEAVDLFAESVPGFYDIILMDIQMPRMNGYEATRTIRAMEREDSKAIPIVAMTADAFVEDIQAASAAGMNEHISKPISTEHLVQVLAHFLGES